MEGPADVAALKVALKELNSGRDVMLLLEERGLVRRRKSRGRWYWTLTKAGRDLNLEVDHDEEVLEE